MANRVVHVVVESHRNGSHPQSVMVSLSVAEVFASHPERDVLKSTVVVVVKSFLCTVGAVSLRCLVCFGSRPQCLSGFVWLVRVVVFGAICQKWPSGCDINSCLRYRCKAYKVREIDCCGNRCKSL